MKRSDFISGLEQALHDHQEFDGYDMQAIMEYIEEHMLPKSIKNPLLPKDMSRFGLADAKASAYAHGYNSKYSNIEYDVNQWDEE